MFCSSKSPLLRHKPALYYTVWENRNTSSLLHMKMLSTEICCTVGNYLGLKKKITTSSTNSNRKFGMDLHTLFLNRDIFRKNLQRQHFLCYAKGIVKCLSKLASLKTLHVWTNMLQFLVLLQQYLWIFPSSVRDSNGWLLNEKEVTQEQSVCTKSDCSELL